MIGDYNKTALSGFFNYNDPLIAAWADNVYEKLRQTGELAGYVTRDKIVRERYNVVDETDQAPIMIKDLDFTFGYAYIGDKLILENNAQENLERVYQVEFEIMFQSTHFADAKFFDAFIVVKNAGEIVVGNLTFSGATFQLNFLHRLKIVRNNIEVTVYVDDVSLGTQLLNQNIDTEFQILYQCDNIPTSGGPDPDYNLDYNDDFLSLNL